MFTGIVEAVGEVSEARPMPGGLRLRIATRLAPELGAGDSVAVNGVCLTAVRCDAEAFEAETSPQTLRVTALGSLAAGASVNLERPLLPTSRLGGHFVLGHVDGVGRIDEIRPEANFRRVAVWYPPALTQWLVPKGSVALDGISLTVASLRDERFEVQIVPYTWTRTHLHAASVGDPVNVECDIIGKHVVRALEAMRGGDAGAER
jgi:riboflavin synthase